MATDHLAHLAWPFFDAPHRALARALSDWAARELAGEEEPEAGAAVDARCRALVARLGDGGWLRAAVPAAHGGLFERLDVRALCLARETLARVAPLADFAFAMQGLGSAPIALFGDDALRARWLPAVRDGRAIAAFALSEADAGSDVTAMRTTARRDGDAWVVDGEKTWISNAGIADFYTLFARCPEAGERGFVALVVEADAPGLAVTRRIATTAPHPLGTLALDGVRVPRDRVLGEPGRGLRVALGTLDVFRSTVGAAALGFARRALDEAVTFARARRVAGGALADQQLARARIAAMATDVDASALLVYRAAWTRDRVAGRVTREAAMAKLYATEAAQRVVDGAVQLLGARGVERGSVTERLYREVRALRIYEGTSEIQHLVIGGSVLEEA